MKMRTSCFYILHILLQILLTTSCNTIYANSFGQSCTLLPLVDSTNYLINDTAFGYVQNNLDMKTHVPDGCAAQGDAFKFCIRNAPSSAEVCKQVSMNIGDSETLGSLTDNPDLKSKSFISNILLKVNVIENSVCLSMPTSRGLMPLICRDKEATLPTEDPIDEDVCRPLPPSCYEGRAKSQTLFSFSGLTIHCLRDSLDKLFYVGNDCPPTDSDQPALTMLKPFPEFQDVMRIAVRAALIIYVIFYGFKVIMDPEKISLEQISIFLMKFMLVSYFAVGFFGGKIINGREVKQNGMTELALPMLVELTSDFTEFTFLSGGAQGLCVFDKAKYEHGYEFYKVWDAIDCRIAYYLGMQLVYNIGSMLSSANSSIGFTPDGAKPITIEPTPASASSILGKIGLFAIFPVFFGFLLGGNIVIVILGMLFVVMFISIVMYFISAYLVCMVTLYAMAYISPIFIPMALFQRTKAYYDGWQKVVISCAIQPAVIGGVVATLLTMYDSTIYGNCVYQRHDYTAGENSFSTFQLMLPASEPEKCEKSVGYKLLQYSSGQGWDTRVFLIFSLSTVSDVLNIGIDFLHMMMYLIIFYYFLKSVNQFVSELAGGASLSGVSINPNMIVDKVIGLAKAAVSAAAAVVSLKSGNVLAAAKNAAEAAKQAGEDTSSNKEAGSGSKAPGGSEEEGSGKTGGIAGGVSSIAKTGESDKGK